VKVLCSNISPLLLIYKTYLLRLFTLSTVPSLDSDDEADCKKACPCAVT
jgi:hypothetical protein